MRSLAFAVLAASLFGPCTVATHPEQEPAWVMQLIATYASEPVTNPPRSIWRARYYGQLVYYVPPICCDQFSALYDSAGTLLCAPDGGFTGKGDGRCSDFAKRRTEPTVVWEDPRSKR